MNSSEIFKKFEEGLLVDLVELTGLSIPEEGDGFHFVVYSGLEFFVWAEIDCIIARVVMDILRGP